MTLKITNTVGDWVSQHPKTSRVFESLQIDYCCGGKVPLDVACSKRELDSSKVFEELLLVINDDSKPSNEWLHAPLSKLCDHIEQTHHAYLKRELPRLTAMIAKVLNAHGASRPELARLAEVFQTLCKELTPHMSKEERVLFPAIRQMEQSTEQHDFHFGSVSNPIRVMEQEHEHAGDALSMIRSVCNEFVIPPDACNTYRAMLDGLRELEENMHQHVHKENNILFPRAIEREKSLAS